MIHTQSMRSANESIECDVVKPADGLYARLMHGVVPKRSIN